MTDHRPNRQTRVADADTPSDIPWAGWLAIGKRVLREFGRHEMSTTAAAVSFLALFAMFSAISAFVAFYGLFADPATVVANMRQFKGFVPADVVIQMIGQMQSVAAHSSATLVSAGVFSGVIALWSAQQGVSSLMVALNVAYRENMPYGPLRHLFKSLFMALEVILGLVLASLLVIGLPLMAQMFDWPGWLVETVRAWGMAMAGLVLFFGLTALYRWVPDREPPRWRWARSGAILVVGFWVIGSLVFSLFVAYSNSYTAMYGSLSAVVLLLTLTYVTVVTVLVGAEFNAQLEFHTARDTTHGARKPMGERGAYMADHVVDDEIDARRR